MFNNKYKYIGRIIKDCVLIDSLRTEFIIPFIIRLGKNVLYVIKFILYYTIILSSVSSEINLLIVPNEI